MADIPEYLLCKPTGYVNELPHANRVSELPFHKLSWEDFERLCFTLANLQGEVEDTGYYGVRGGKQEGIDLYAKNRSDAKYTTYQCKRERGFTPTKIATVVDTFLIGTWKDRTKEFVLCSSVPLNSTKIANAIVAQRGRLNQSGIEFAIWDSPKLCLLLKTEPQIVSEFFTPHYARAFCDEKEYDKYSPPVQKKDFTAPTDYISRYVIDHYELGTYRYLTERKTLRTVLLEKKRIALLGWAGCGKSIELEMLAASFSSPDVPYYPFHVSLNLFTTIELKDYVSEFDRIPQESIVLILDGYDEIQRASMDSVRRKIGDFARQYPKVHLVVSCRENFYQANSAEKELDTLTGFHPYHLADLTHEDLQEYLDKKIGVKKNDFLSKVEKNGFRELVRLPYYLIKLVSQYQEPPGQIASSKAELFESIISSNIRKDVARYYPDDKKGKEERIRELLNKVAFVYECRGKNLGTAHEINQILPDTDEQKLLSCASSLIVKTDGEEETWKFIHNNIQEYLVAKALSKQSVKTIRRTICFEPRFTKVKPTWVNTVSFLMISISRSDLAYDELLSWLINNAPEIVINFEPDKVSDDVRLEILQSILEYYEKEERRVNYSKHNVSRLAKFSESEGALRYLLHKLEHAQSSSTVLNCLEILAEYDISGNHSQLEAEAKKLIEGNVFGLPEFEYYSLIAYMRCFRLTENEFDRLVEKCSGSESSSVRYTLFNGIQRHGYQSKFIEPILGFTEKYLHRNQLDSSDVFTNEFDALCNCLIAVSDKATLLRVFAFVQTNYGRIEYSVYFEELIPKLLKRFADSFADDTDFLDILVAIYKDNHMAFHRKYGNDFLACFQENDLLDNVFYRIYSASTALHWEVFIDLAPLLTHTTIAFIKEEFDQNRLSLELVRDFQNAVRGYNPELLDAFHKAVNEIQNVPLPPNSNWHEIQLDRKTRTQHLIFDKDALISAIRQVFTDFALDKIDQESYLKISKTQLDAKYLPVVFDRIRVQEHGQSRTLESIIQHIDLHWDSILINNVIDLLKSDNIKTALTDAQMSHIRGWCNEKAKIIDFKNSMTMNGDSTRFNPDALKLSFLIRELNLNDYEEPVYLDMLSFTEFGEGRTKIFDFVASVVEPASMNSRIKKNLLEGIQFGEVFQKHVEYCVEQQLNDVCDMLLTYLGRSRYHHSIALDAYQKLNGNLDKLELSLVTLKGDYLHSVLRVLISPSRPSVIKYVKKCMTQATDDEEKWAFATMLMSIGNRDGLRYYLSYLGKNKSVPHFSFADHYFGRFTTLRALPLMLDVFVLGFDETIPKDRFNDPRELGLTGINSICLFNDNFVRCMRYFQFVKLSNKLRGALGMKSIPANVIRNLTHRLEYTERSYYMQKANGVSVADALDKYRMLHYSYGFSP